MSKKILIPMTIALIATMLFASAAYAAAPTPAPAQPATGQTGRLAGFLGNLKARLQGQQPIKAAEIANRRRIVVQFVSLQDGKLTVKDLKGGDHSLPAPENALLLSPDLKPLALSDLKTGQWLMAAGLRLGGKRPADAQLPAVPADSQSATGQTRKAGSGPLLITVLPDGFDPAQWKGARMEGRVSAVDAAKGTITLGTGDHQRTLNVDAKTTYLGSAKSLAQVKPGMAVQAAAADTPKDGKSKPAGPLTAAVIYAHPALDITAGKVQSVDAAKNSLTLQTRKGEALTILVTAETRFYGKAVKSLADLKINAPALIFIRLDPDGSRTALAAVAGGLAKR
jgi:hypothetical protein